MQYGHSEPFLQLRIVTNPPLRLHRREPLERGIRRIARGQVDTACLALQGGGPSAVHEARKALKKIRALLRLVAPEFGRTAFRAEKERFQEAARLLSPLRDAEVRLEALDAVIQSGGFDAADFTRVRADLEATATTLARGANRPKRRAVEILQKARDRVGRWPLGDLEWKLLAKEIRRTYRKGRKALETHQREQTPESFHAWRKRVKELWYHLRIVRALLPKNAAEWIPLCDEIGERAGTAHDLALLRETLLKCSAEA